MDSCTISSGASVMTARDTQVGGSHYQNKIQPFDIIDAWELDFYEGNVLKYLLRYRYKNGSQDLKKAQHLSSEGS